MSDKGSLYHFLPEETNPPPEVWSRIAKALDDSEMSGSASGFLANEGQRLNKLGEKQLTSQTGSEISSMTDLAAMEVEPPPSVWHHIQQKLDGPVVIPIAPPKNKIRSIWVAAVAAACIGAILLIAPLLNNRKELSSISANIGSKLLQKPGKADSILKGLVPNPKTADSLNKSSTLFPPATISFLQAIGPNGNTVKVSPKLTPMIEFFDKKDPAPSSPQKKMWQQKLNAWQAMINAPGANTAAINFADPIDLIRFLENKK